MQELVEVVRVEGGRILAVLAAATGDLQLAEDAVQDAAVTALEVWPRTGVPADPSAWLYVAARRKAIDIVRRESTRNAREQAATDLFATLTPTPPPPARLRDDSLRLLFTCCHPALALDAQVALALRTLCGLATDEVARVLLVPEATMAKRLVRAKQKIGRAAIPYRVPTEDELPRRLAGVAAVVHLVYTAGHHAPRDEVVRAELCDEAIRLARLLVAVMPDPTTEGLLALLLLTDARRPSRLAPDGTLVTLTDQDRSRWRTADIGEGIALLNRSLVTTAGRADAYQLQAAIAACHATAPTYEATDWDEVLRLYDVLAALRPNPAVDLNAAVAAGEAHGAAAGLRRLRDIDARDRNHLWHLACAELLVRHDEADEAAAAFELARAHAPSAVERRHIDGRIAATRRAERYVGSPGHRPSSGRDSFLGSRASSCIPGCIAPRSPRGGGSIAAGAEVVVASNIARRHSTANDEEGDVRVEGSVTTISWVPAEAVERDARAGFRLGTWGADEAPPTELGPDIDATLEAAGDRYRFANHLWGFAEFDDDGEVLRFGEQGSGRLGHPTVREGVELAIGTVPMPELRGEPAVGPGWVRFDQTWGGRTASSMARATLRPPFVRFDAPVAWTTLELTLRADGRVDGQLTGASPFPRHWIYDTDGRLHATSAITDWTAWAGSAVGVHTPWGHEDSPAFVTAAESALERELADMLLRDTARPAVRRLQAGEVLSRQGDPGVDLYIIVDGVLVVSVDGAEVVELGPGAVLGERAVLQGGRRTATLTAGSPAKVMVVPAERVDRDRLAGLAASHRRDMPLRHR